MATSTSYRLPGVYSNETTGPFVNVSSGGNAVVAFVGPALGYSSASQQATVSGVEPIALEQSGVITGGVSITSQTTGTKYVSGEDFTEATDMTGVTTVRRRIQSLSLSKSTITNRQKTFYTAEPEFSIMVDSTGVDVEGYAVKGSLQVVDTTADTELVEGTDYAIDYFKGVLGVVDGGALADPDANGHVLSIGLEWVTGEPIKLVGESAWAFEHDYISDGGLSSGDSIRLVSCAYTDDDESYEWGDTPGSEEGYIENIDFVIDYQTGRITRTASSRIPSFDEGKGNYLYAEFAYDAIRDGEQVVISYMYQGDEYGTVSAVSSYAETVNLYGPAWNSVTGEVTSQLSLAAYIAFQNGMPSCYMAAVQGSVVGKDSEGNPIIGYTTSDWENAFNALTTVNGIDIVVPLTDDETYINLCRAHLATMLANQDERVMICGLDGTADPVTISGLIAKANSFNSRDVWMVGPSTVRFRNPITNVIDVLPGYYLAVAVAGYNASVPHYTPLTRKAISGFYSANEYATKLNKTNACANGVMYVDELNGQLRILHGTSTEVATVVARETNVTLTKYFIIKRVRNMFETGYIGEVMTASTTISIKSAMQDMLIALINNGYILNYDNLVVVVDESVATQINIAFRYTPVYGVNYIQISFAVNTATGSITAGSEMSY